MEEEAKLQKLFSILPKDEESKKKLIKSVMPRLESIRKSLSALGNDDIDDVEWLEHLKASEDFDQMNAEERLALLFK